MDNDLFFKTNDKVLDALPGSSISLSADDIVCVTWGLYSTYISYEAYVSAVFIEGAIVHYFKIHAQRSDIHRIKLHMLLLAIMGVIPTGEVGEINSLDGWGTLSRDGIISTVTGIGTIHSHYDAMQDILYVDDETYEKWAEALTN